MYFVAAVLTIMSGVFYAASRHEIGSFGVTMCQYGSPFCDNPLLVLVGAGLAACWGAFVSVRWCACFEACDFCYDAIMPVICPTCQTPRVITRSLSPSRSSRPAELEL
jgi:hypothetical protein